jgi:hypothetical protein
MEDKEILNEIKFISDIDKEKQNKKSKNERSKKSIIKQKEKRKITKENNEKLENLSSNGDKNEPSKDLFINNISKKEKILVNKEIKLQKTYDKIIIKSTEKKFFECSKEGKNKEQKSLENYNSEEANSHKIEKK